MNTKQCIKCGNTKDIEHFSFRNKAKGTHISTCKSCWNEYGRNYYNNNKSRRIDINKKWRQSTRKKFTDIKTDFSCVICGEPENICLDFHHLDSSQKEFSIANAVNRMSTTRLLKEIQKCVVLCSNCHRKVHAGLITI